MQFALILMQGTLDQRDMQRLLMPLLTLVPLLILVGLVIVIVPFWFICKKAGFSPWLSLLNIIPLGNLALIYVLAFAEWKTTPPPAYRWAPPPPPPQP
ncbi:MAG: hypothetical protein ACLGRW_18320 [Acidobacteriota bacterium]|jgi:hypothetical protein